MKSKRHKLLRWGATALAMAGLTLGLTTTTASANGTNGWYQLCSRGTYKAFAEYVVEGNTNASYLTGFVGARVTGGGSSTSTSSVAGSLTSPASPMRTFIAYPGKCVPIYMDGNPVDVYLQYDDGGQVNLGRAWYQANIATAGYKSSPSWYFF
ncbi:hypothetical protein [Streptomyces sp. NBC_00102]|uniref:hypothetical protein n=1 Tax=Streptomyces sp. NBC_00102 TaxID=2975652 RepID=UPI0022591A3D|nr:hypothetical protein [Streptomyces sp. NBC_00102]MCX5400485.1 hypothetical protein [Streptomyces sp. NBC_00102]